MDKMTAQIRNPEPDFSLKTINIRAGWKWIAALLGAVALAVIALLLLTGRRQTVLPDTQEGIQHLQELEGKDIALVEQEIKQIKQEERHRALEDGTLPVWAQFGDSAIFGDSRTVGFSFYEFLESSRVLADAGLTIADLPDYLDQIRLLNPSYLYLCTGLNDVSIGLWPTPEDYVAAYEELMQQLMAEFPDTQIIVNSIFPAQDPAFLQSTDWYEIPAYNTAVKAWCEEKGYAYIDNTQVYEEHKDLYDPDGIHFQKDFYEYWAINMLSGVDMEWNS